MIGKATPGGSGSGGGVGGNGSGPGPGPVGRPGRRVPGPGAMKVERRNQSAGLLPPTPPWNRR